MNNHRNSLNEETKDTVNQGKRQSKEFQVSSYNHLWDDTPSIIDELTYILYVKKPNKEVDYAREVLAKEGKKAYDIIKSKLGGVTGSTICGINKEEKNIKTYNGIIVIDIDDKGNEHLDLSTYKELLKEDKFSRIVHSSISGYGFCVFVKIDAKNGDEFRSAYRSLEQYYKKTYDLTTDKSCSNPTRFRFLSSDVDLYHNMDAEIYTDRHKIESRPKKKKCNSSKSISTDEAFKNLLVWWDRNYGFAQGSRNANLLILAQSCNEFGVSIQDVEDYALSNFQESDFKENEILKTIKNAYNRTVPNSKVFNDSSERQTDKHDLKEFKKKHLSTTQTDNVELFWDFTENEKQVRKYYFDASQYSNWLNSQGFKFHITQLNEELVHVKDNLVSRVSDGLILKQSGDFIKTNDINAFNSFYGIDYFKKHQQKQLLDRVEIEVLRDNKNTSYLYFNNGILEVKKDSKRLIPYKEAPSMIWTENRLKHDWNETKEISDFDKFLSFITPDSKAKDNLKRYIGYLLSTFKVRGEEIVVCTN